MRSLIKALFTTNTGNELVKGGMKVLDNAFYTNQERDAHIAKLNEQGLELNKLAWQDGNVARSITRRILALLIVLPFSLSLLIYIITSPFQAEWATTLNVALEFVVSELDGLVMLVLGFYFGNHIIKGFNSKV